MVCMGWDALDRWGDDVDRVEPLTGGGVNEVWSVRVNGQLAVARLGRRSDADLGWETELLRHLNREGMTVPVPIPTRDEPVLPRRPGRDDLRRGTTARDGGGLASCRRHISPASPTDAGLASASGLAIVG